MSNTEKDQQFLTMADQFIDLANSMGPDIDRGKISAAFLYAAARFNTFIVAASASSKEDFRSYQDKAKQYFLDEYKKMLDEHCSDYEQHFESYKLTDLKNQTIN